MPRAQRKAIRAYTLKGSENTLTDLELRLLNEAEELAALVLELTPPDKLLDDFLRAQGLLARVEAVRSTYGVRRRRGR